MRQNSSLQLRLIAGRSFRVNPLFDITIEILRQYSLGYVRWVGLEGDSTHSYLAQTIMSGANIPPAS